MARATRTLIALFATLPLAASACADGAAPPIEEPAGLEAGKADDADGTLWTYFRGVRMDARRCMYPLCGGVYVARLNQPKTKCADGVWAKDCYVGDFDFSAIGYEGEAAVELSQLVREGRLVVRGEIETGFFPEFPEIAVFAVTEAWKAATDNAPTGIFHQAHDRGIVCITTPCVSVELTRLNRNADPRQDVAGVNIDKVGASDDQIHDFYEQLGATNVLVAGKLEKVTGPGGTAKQLTASQYYTRVAELEAVGQPCGGRGNGPCPEGTFCQYTDKWCGMADGGGTCQPIPELCAQNYEPVCGCDGQTYSNDCERQAAGVGFGTEGECKVGAGCKLSGCSGQLCLAAEVEPMVTTCDFRPEYACFQQHGVCEDLGEGCAWTMSPELEQCLKDAAGNTDQSF